MSNHDLFQSTPRDPSPAVDIINQAGGTAYAFDPRQALAQYVVTGTFHGVYYASAPELLDQLLSILDQIKSEPSGDQFIAKAAHYARHSAHMKDTPAFLVAWLGCNGSTFFGPAFESVIDNGKMLRNFVQMIMSGRLGRRTLSYRLMKMIKRWFDTRGSRVLLNASVGNSPSIADVIRLSHPIPKALVGVTGEAVWTKANRQALYGYLLDRRQGSGRTAALPEVIREFEEFKRQIQRGEAIERIPNINFQLLTSFPLTPGHWKQIALNAGHQWLRMNINTMCRHGVFDSSMITNHVATKLRDLGEVRRARQFPYQFYSAIKGCDPGAPPEILIALQRALELSVGNLPKLPDSTLVFVDMSGSMQAPVTGDRGSATTEITCKEVAALFAAVAVKANIHTKVFWFNERCYPQIPLNPLDSVATLADQISMGPGGGTCISAPLAYANHKGLQAPLVIYLSDNQSWLETIGGSAYEPWAGRTPTLEQWALFKKRSPGAKMVAVDLQPYANTQAPDRVDILNVGGWSDQVFTAISAFAHGDPRFWVDLISASSFHVDRGVEEA